MIPNHLKDQCRHHRYCFNNRCDPRGAVIPEKLQNTVNSLSGTLTKRGAEEDKQAAKILGISGIKSIVEDNKNGFRPHGNIFGCFGFDPKHQPTNFHDCIWNAMEAATLLAK